MEMGNRPLAIVGGMPITDQDIDQAIAQLGQRGAAYKSAQGRSMILEQLIAQKLFLTDAKRNLMEREPAFKEQMARVKDEMLTQYAISKTLESARVTDIEARKFYDENADQFAGQPTVTASHILVDTEEKAKEILEKINAKEITFEDAAKQFSSCPSSRQGGSLGEFGHGQMVAEFDEACFAMEIGEIRGPIKTQFGYHLIRLDGKGESEPVKYSEAVEEIKEHLVNEKRQKAYQSRVNQLKILYPVER